MLLTAAVLLARASSNDLSYHIELAESESSSCVVLLHGLARTESSMRTMATALHDAGYTVANVGYPSRHFPIEELSRYALDAGLTACRAAGASRWYIVTHSLGGILLRHYLSHHTVPELERVVMLAPPNRGSAIVDKLRNVPGFFRFNGPAGMQLGTDANSVPLRLGPAQVDTAVIAGSRSINLFLSTLLDNPDDGKVSVSSARLQGMCAMLVMPVSHTFVMKDREVIRQTLSYLQTGRFASPDAEYLQCQSTGKK